MLSLQRGERPIQRGLCSVSLMIYEYKMWKHHHKFQKKKYQDYFLPIFLSMTLKLASIIFFCFLTCLAIAFLPSPTSPSSSLSVPHTHVDIHQACQIWYSIDPIGIPKCFRHFLFQYLQVRFAGLRREKKSRTVRCGEDVGYTED